MTENLLIHSENEAYSRKMLRDYEKKQLGVSHGIILNLALELYM